MSKFQHDPYGTLLSPDGEARRQRILRLAIQEAGAVRQRSIYLCLIAKVLRWSNSRRPIQLCRKKVRSRNIR